MQCIRKLQDSNQFWQLPFEVTTAFPFLVHFLSPFLSHFFFNVFFSVNFPVANSATYAWLFHLLMPPMLLASYSLLSSASSLLQVCLQKRVVATFVPVCVVVCLPVGRFQLRDYWRVHMVRCYDALRSKISDAVFILIYHIWEDLQTFKDGEKISCVPLAWISREI